MGCKQPLYFVVAAVALWGCYAPPSGDEAFEESIIVTSHDEEVDFGQFRTAFVRPAIRLVDEGVDVGDPANPELLDPLVADPLIATTETNLTDRGYTLVDTKEEADLAVELMYLRSVNSQQYCYAYWGWYDYYYWSYYPYYPYCDTTVWRSGTLLTTAVDLTTVAPAPVVGAVQPAVSLPGVDQILRSVWTSAVYGAEVDSVQYVAQRAISGINQAFVQSPYLTATP